MLASGAGPLEVAVALVLIGALAAIIAGIILLVRR